MPLRDSDASPACFDGLCKTHISLKPSAEEFTEIKKLAFGISVLKSDLEHTLKKKCALKIVLNLHL